VSEERRTGGGGEACGGAGVDSAMSDRRNGSYPRNVGRQRRLDHRLLYASTLHGRCQQDQGIYLSIQFSAAYSQNVAHWGRSLLCMIALFIKCARQTCLKGIYFAKVLSLFKKNFNGRLLDPVAKNLMDRFSPNFRDW